MEWKDEGSGGSGGVEGEGGPRGHGHNNCFIITKPGLIFIELILSVHS